MNSTVSKIFLSFLSIMLTGLVSCVSTDIIEPDNATEPNDELVINLSAPVDLQTRAHEGCYLRYTAKLFPLVNGSSYDTKNMQRQEILESSNSEENKIVFKNLNSDVKYRVMVFADYIKSNSKKSDGTYTDYFYDTSSTDNTININTTPGSSTSTGVTSDFFNNDDYDCFSATDTIHKDKYQKELDLVLTRAVSKVIFKDNSNSPGELDKISFTHFEIFYKYNQEGQTYHAKATRNSFSIDSSDLKDPNDDKTVFFFYTFGPASQSENLVYSFSTTAENISTPLTKSDVRVPVRKNYKTIMSGTLIPQLQDSSSSGNGAASKEGDDLIVNVTTSDDWFSPDMESIY